jgi:hypothetical protein
MESPNIPTPDAPVKQPVASRLAYGSAAQPDNMFSYRMERGFPFQRAGSPVTVSSTFNTLKLNTGSAVGLHGPVNQSALTNGLVDPAQPGFSQKGSNVPTFVTVPFTFHATGPTALTISWPAYALRRANRTLTTSNDTAIPAGTISITGLTANTTYWYYPYWSETAQTLGWAGAGNATSAGSPAIAQTLQSDTVLQFASFQGFVPLNTLQFTQPAAGSTTQTGGYASGNPNITGGGRSYRIL